MNKLNLFSLNLFFLIIFLPIGFISAQSKFYVDSTSPLPCTGSLSNPFINIQDALEAAVQGDTILVAHGTYYPDESSCGMIDTDDRAISFDIPNGLVLMGGYVDAFTTRDFVNYPSILSGDIDQNSSDSTFNSFHVVRTQFVDSTTVVDGFTITGGNAMKELSLTVLAADGITMALVRAMFPIRLFSIAAF